MNTCFPTSVCCAVRRASQIGLVAILAAGLFGGCSTLVPHRNPAVDQAQADAPEYKVILTSPVGNPHIYTGRITGPLTVQDALRESGALDRFRGMQIDLARQVPEKDQILRLPVLFDSKERHVMEEQNYAIHPGDELLVRKDNPGPLDAVFKSLGSVTPSVMNPGVR